MEALESANAGNVGTHKVHAVLSLLKLEFSGNHRVDIDTTGTFDPPEWLAFRADKQWPICYTRTKNIKLKATFTVMAPPTATEDVKIHGIAKVVNTVLEWNGTVSVSPGSKEVVTGELTSSAALPNQVCYEGGFQIQWDAQPPGEPAYLAGASANVLYVTLGDPSGTPPFWTLLEISCRAAAGATNMAQLVDRTYAPFTSRTLTRMRDGVGLVYWKPNETSNARNTPQLLSGGNGSGECGSWAEFLIDMYKVHGENGRKVMVVVTVADLDLSFDKDKVKAAGARGFLVKNWRFKGAAKYGGDFTHRMVTLSYINDWGMKPEDGDCEELQGVAGQRNDNPPPAFYNHFIVQALGYYYDPSYGSPPVKTALEWENASIDGLFARGRCAGPKANHAARAWLEFH